MGDVSRLMFRGAIPRMVEIGLGGIVYFSCIQATLRFFDEKEKGKVKSKDKVPKI
jgi:hypothetical protein